MTEDKGNLIGYDPLAWMKTANDTAAVAGSHAAIKVNDEEKNTATEDSQTIAALSDAFHDSEIKLDKVLTIKNVSDIKYLLVNAFKNNARVNIDASEVVQVDTAHLQLFVISKQIASSEDKVLSFDFASDEFITAAELLGVFEVLELDNIMGGFF